MYPDIHLIEIAIVVLAALTCGLFFERFKQPAVLGYILAGVILGPSCCRFISNREVVNALAELGVLLLLFLIGMELSLRAFKSVWLPSLVTMCGQLIMSVAVVLGIGQLFDLSAGLMMVLSCAIALSSTAVAIKMLERIDELHTETGRITIGVLIAQDLAIIPMILVLRSFGTGQLEIAVLIKVGVAIGLLGLLIWYLHWRQNQKLRLPFSQIVADHQDLRPLAALIFCFGMAALSGIIGLSAAYGAFLGGLILGNTTERQAMIESTKPIQSVLMMVFFLSIGLLIDFVYIWHHLGKVLLLLFFITIGKTAFNIFILHALRQPWERAFLSGLILSQIGEFAFLLATLGYDLRLIDTDGHRLVLSLAALSLTLSPFWMMAARRLHDAAPQHYQNIREIVVSVYGPELTFMCTATRFLGSRLKGAPHQIIQHSKTFIKKIIPFFSSQRSDKSKDT
jgi:CPA2 family monovalent cation:H+ antiporter-2